jgi:hypothetical protein
MADYKSALEAGFEAAKKAGTARKEVKEILHTFKTEILNASNGKLLIEIRKFDDPPPKITLGVPAGASFAEAYMRMLREKPFHLALGASNPTRGDMPPKELAGWKQAKDGYPCTLSWGKKELQCEDGAALQDGLAELLKDPNIGEILFSLTTAVPPETKQTLVN